MTGVAGGGGAVTIIWMEVLDALNPDALARKETVYVPAVAYDLEAAIPVAVVPSPKVHEKEVPSSVSPEKEIVDPTVKEAPLLGDTI